MKTEQMQVWSGEFGQEYTRRNRFEDAEAFEDFYRERFGISRTDLNRSQLADIPRDAVFVEVGANIGNQLDCLFRDGFTSLYGVELQAGAVEQCHQTRPGLGVVQGSALDMPFRDGFADVVYTSNVLIHISPNDLPRVIDEMVRVSRRWIWGFEYFAEDLTEVNYRGHENLLWKADYGRLFRERHPDLRLVKEADYTYKDGSGLVDRMYLLEKTGAGAAREG